MSETQKGVSCPQRGRMGHTVSEEARRKIGEAQARSWNLTAQIGLICRNCGKSWVTEMWRYTQFLRGTKGRGPFCSAHCSMMGRNSMLNEESRRKISDTQRGISIMSRGKPGHIVYEETRHRLSLTRTGGSTKQDYAIVPKEMAYRGIASYVNLTKRPIPDAIFIENGKLIAVEVEKERWKSGIRNKMQEYADHGDKWDKVILVWYSPEGQRLREWVLDDGQWTITLR